MRGRSFDPLKNAQLEQLPPPQRNFVTITVYYTTIPEGEVNSGTVYIYRDAKRRGMYLALFTEGDNWFSIYQIGWIKMKKVTFCKFKTSLRRNFVQFTNFLRILSSAFLRFCCKFSMKIIFYQPVNTDKPTEFKKYRLLGICLCDCFIYRSNFVFHKCLEGRRHLGSDRKTVPIAKDIPG